MHVRNDDQALRASIARAPGFGAFLLALMLAVFICSAPALAQSRGGVIAGMNYKELAQAQPTEAAPGTVEVIEFLWYDCQTCFLVEPALKRWLKEREGHVTLRRMPALIGTHMVHYARAFYAAESLGVLDQVHDDLYEALHRYGRSLDREDRLADFFAEHGVDRARFLSVFRSSAVAAKVRNGQQASRTYELAGAPTFIIAGRYRVDPTMVANVSSMIEVLDFLVERELEK